jgi:SpoVK/Ycf46/Vps4 family AAA+-type ATPase
MRISQTQRLKFMPLDGLRIPRCSIFVLFKQWLRSGGFMQDVGAPSISSLATAMIWTGLCEESLLNKLLNEMDGLKEDADILFVLTTNRPEELESALAGRPGRIDQAIEVGLPDEIGRGKLVRLYGRGLTLNATIIDEAVRRTKASARPSSKS